ncbi:MAG: hypothetical protein ACYC9W_06820 [Candidatus Limnocylindria bacterium]
MTEAAAHWEAFFVASAGATAALTGLLFIAVSIGLDQILETPGLDSRALEAVALLVGALVLSLSALAPGQTAAVFATEALVVGVSVAILVVRGTLSTRRIARAHPLNFALKLVFAVVTVPPYFVAAMRAAEADASLSWVAIGTVLGIVSACISAWVLLVEIQRDRPRRGAR